MLWTYLSKLVNYLKNMIKDLYNWRIETFDDYVVPGVN